MAEHVVMMQQTDTYFRVPAGQLKLREQEPGADQLMFYSRQDEPAPKGTSYQVMPVETHLGMHTLPEVTTTSSTTCAE